MGAMAASTDRVTDYARRVVDGEIPAGALHRSACQRHLDDIDRGAFVFDVETVDRVVKICELLPHYKGKWAGQPMTLEPFQVFLVGSLFGWKDRRGLRRFKQAYIEMPRKNGKTQLAAGLGLILGFFDREPGADVYCVATKRDQAKIAFEAARQMVLRSTLRKKLDVRVANINQAATASKLEPLGGDADSLDGLNAHGVILDEIHKMKTSELIDVMVTATGAREQPLVIEITTAGIGAVGPCWDHHEYTSKVVRGVVDDPSWFGMVFAADPEDDWTQPETWAKGNPNYGVSVNVDDLARKAKQAQHVAAFEPEFRRLHLGQWVQQAEKFLSLLKWDQEANAAPIDRAALRGRPCVLGLDVSSRRDFTAIVAIFARPGGGVVVLPHIFAPESVLANGRRTAVPLEAWRRGGFLTVTPGDTIDHDAIKKTLIGLGKEFKVLELAFDSWNAMQLATEMRDDHGFEVVEIRQGFRSLSEPTKELDVLVAEGKLQHGGHPVLRWMADNLVVRVDPNGNLAPDKDKAAEKIDGIVALIMALARRGQIMKTRAAGPRERGILVL